VRLTIHKASEFMSESDNPLSNFVAAFKYVGNLLLKDEEFQVGSPAAKGHCVPCFVVRGNFFGDWTPKRTSQHGLGHREADS